LLEKYEPQSARATERDQRGSLRSTTNKFLEFFPTFPFPAEPSCRWNVSLLEKVASVADLPRCKFSDTDMDLLKRVVDANGRKQ